MKFDKKQYLEIAQEVLQEEIDALIDVKGKLNGEFTKAVDFILKSDKVVVSGIGKSGLIGRKIAATFASIGQPATFLHPVEALHGDIGIVQENDTVILLSKSGSTDEIVRLIPFLKSRNAKIISIVGNMKSYMAEYSDVALDATVTHEACPLDLAPTSSTLVALALGDALAVAIMKLKNVTIEDFAQQHPLGQLGRNITLQVKDVMHKDTSLPLINEEAYFRDAIIVISNKGLGCVCVVDESNKLRGLITDGDIRRALQNDVDIRELTVKNVMTKNPVTTKNDIFLGEALALMENRASQLSVLPVVDSFGKCIGVIRLHDIVRSGI